MASNKVTTLAGNGRQGFKDAKANDALFNMPTGLVVQPDGSVLVVDNGNNRIRKILSDGTTSTWTGDCSEGLEDDQGKQQGFNFEGYSGICLNKNGNVFLTHQNSDYSVSMISREGIVSNVAPTSKIFMPYGIVGDNCGNIYVSQEHGSIVKKTPAGTITYFAGKDKPVDSFDSPWGLTMDSNQNVIAADWANHMIRKISPSGEVTTLAGNGTAGKATGNGNSACLQYPSGVSVDGDDNVIVADGGNHRILKITRCGNVSVLAGIGKAGLVNGVGSKARFNTPSDVAVDNEGNVLVSDEKNHCIRVIAAGLSPPYQGQSSKEAVELPTILSRSISNAKYSDVEIKVGKHIFPAHRLILSRCPFFEAAFQNKCLERVNRRVVLSHIDENAFRHVLEYLYKEKVEIPVDCDVLALRSAAEFLGLADLQHRCEIEMRKRLRVNNLARCYQYAKVNSLNCFKRRCLEVANESGAKLASVLLSKDYIEIVEPDSELKQEFLEDCRSFRK